MEDETFADYILNEKDWGKKLEIMYYFKKKANIYYDNTVIFKTLVTKMFLDFLKSNYPEINVDANEIITARLLCDCLKVENSTCLDEIKSYAQRGAVYLAKLGFNEKFCKICEGVNRYKIDKDRPIESDILELADQFGGMVLDRPERIGFKPDEALTMIQFRNLKNKNNQLLPQFIQFIEYLEKVEIM